MIALGRQEWMGVRRGYRHRTSPISSLDFTFSGQNIVTGLHPISSLDLTLNGGFPATDRDFLHLVTKRIRI